MGCLLEKSGSDSKAVWNDEVAPYKTHIISIGEAGAAIAEKLYKGTRNAILDMTDERAGSKFANADLIGAPLRVVISDKTLAADSAEVNGEIVSLQETEKRIKLNEGSKA
jgi:prolyl-tRNA synthetase